METLQAVLDHKGRLVHSVSPETTVHGAIEAMCEAHIGALLVTTAGIPLGIFTERDLMRRVILARRDPAATLVEDVMTRDLVCVDPDTDVRKAMSIMTERRCRHLPVMSAGRVSGMISIGDLVRFLSQEQAIEIRLLTDYVRGAYA